MFVNDDLVKFFNNKKDNRNDNRKIGLMYLLTHIIT